MNSTEQAFEFLINAAFDAAILLFLFRFILQIVQVDYYNPLTQFIVKYTKPILKPLSNILPTIKGWNLAALAVMLLLESIKIYLNIEIATGMMPNILGILIWAVGDLIYYFLHLYLFAILGLAILSWVKPTGGNALMEILYKITMPLMRPVRRVIPPMGGIDISPIPVLIGLKFLSILLVEPIVTVGMRLAGS
ncbi:MAG: hypothetical protein CMF49_07685 [Legionellales bacterium]|nr:hypothetical protein [Legionellales bacterium]|tara:strand:- start:478 stop:1056 length:579 start_codon:yes stop_codon:yes gene_type:complete